MITLEQRKYEHIQRGGFPLNRELENGRFCFKVCSICLHHQFSEPQSEEKNINKER